MSEPEIITVTKKELVNRIAEDTGQTKVVIKNILQRFLDEIIDELVQGNRIEFREFGVFEVRQRAARQAQNPRTLEKVIVPSKRVVKFKVGRTMRERVCGDDEPEECPVPAKNSHTTDSGSSTGGKSSAGKSPGKSSPPSTPPPTSNSPF